MPLALGRAVAIVSLGVLSCASGAERLPSSALVPPSLAGDGARFLTGCKETCVHTQMMRAVSAAMIERQCEKSCAADWALPPCVDRRSVTAAADKRVRLIGTLVKVDPANAQVGGPAGALRLDDGLELELSSGPGISSLGELVKLENQRVIVAATVRPGTAPVPQGVRAEASAFAHLDFVTTVVAE